jgi:glycosyltransferase involved in cell wall biosynthesis
VSIGFFCSEYPLALANALAQDHDVTLFLSRENLAVRFPGAADLEQCLAQRQALHPNIHLRLINYATGQYTAKVGMARRLVRAISAVQPDVVHYQSGGDPWIPLALPWLRRFPFVATIHDAGRHVGDGPASLQVTNLIVTWLAHQIIVHGQQQANLLIHNFHPAPAKLNVVPMGALGLLSKPQTPLPSDSRLVLFFGRLRAYKGLEVLLKAAPLIAKCVPNVRFVIAGSGECPAVLQAAADHPAWFEVHNRFIPVDEVPQFFQRAALVVQPYVEASQSGVLPLAYQFARPVVATRVGSIPEALDDGRTGYLVAPDDAPALAQAIVRLLQDADLRERMGQAGALKLAQDLSWDAIARKTLAVYERARMTANNRLVSQRQMIQ